MTDGLDGFASSLSSPDGPNWRTCFVAAGVVIEDKACNTQPCPGAACWFWRGQMPIVLFIKFDAELRK